MKIWTKGLFTYVEDERIPIIKKLLESTMILTDIQMSTIYLGPENVLFAVCNDTIIYYMELNECLPGPEIIIDGDHTFAKDVIENDGRDPSVKTKTIKVSSYGLTDYQAIIRNDLLVTIRMKQLFNTYYIYKNQKTPRFSGTDMNKNDEEFKELLSLKADQGAKFFRGRMSSPWPYTNDDSSNSFIFPIFTGFPSVTKADNVNLNVYYFPDPSMGENTSYMQVIEFVIYKKKINKNLHIVYRVLV